MPDDSAHRGGDVGALEEAHAEAVGDRRLEACLADDAADVRTGHADEAVVCVVPDGVDSVGGTRVLCEAHDAARISVCVAVRRGEGAVVDAVLNEGPRSAELEVASNAADGPDAVAAGGRLERHGSHVHEAGEVAAAAESLTNTHEAADVLVAQGVGAADGAGAVEDEVTQGHAAGVAEEACAGVGGGGEDEVGDDVAFAVKGPCEGGLGGVCADGGEETAVVGHVDVGDEVDGLPAEVPPVLVDLLHEGDHLLRGLDNEVCNRH